MTPTAVAERRLIALLSLAAFAAAGSMRVADAQLPELASTFGVGLGAAAQVITAFSIAYGLMQFVYGPLGDRVGKWRVVSGAAMASGIATLGCALAPDLPTLLLARVLAGATAAGVIPLSMAWVGDAVPYEQRQPVLARFLVGQITGLAIGAWAGGLAADFGYWRLPFIALALWFLAAGLMLWRVRNDAEAHAPTIGRSGHPLREAQYVLRQPWARTVLAVVFAEGVVLFGALAFIATHLHLAYGLRLSQAGAIVALFAVGGLIFVVASRILVRRFGEAGLASAGGTTMLLGLAAIGLSPVWWTAPVACAATGIGFYMLHNTLQTNATQMAPLARGAAVSLFGSAFFLGQTVGVALAAPIVVHAGTAVVIVGGAVAVAIVGWIFARLRRSPAAPGLTSQ